MKAKTKTKRVAKSLPIAIIGGGPAGMTAAQTAVGNYKQVIVYDKNPVPGKKLGSIKSRSIYVSEKLSPGETASAFGSKKSFILPAFKAYGWKKIRDYLHKLGFSVSLNGIRRLTIPPEESSRFSIKLKEGAESSGVLIKKSSRVSDIVISRGKVNGVIVNGVVHPVSAVVIASGSFSSPKFGSTKDGYAMAKKAGHKILPLKPAMVGFEIAEKYGKILSGILIKDCRMDVYQDENLEFSDREDIIFTEYGVEGNLILDHSLKFMEMLKKGEIKIHLDLMPDKSRIEIEKILGQNLENKDRTTVWEILTRYMPDRMLDVMHRMIRVHCRKPAVTLSNLERKMLAIWVKDLVITIKKPRPFNETMGILGGVSLKDIDPKTMCSKKVKNLYFAGEVLDLLGPWGGYNIEMAFATGYLAGFSAAKAVKTVKTKK